MLLAASDVGAEGGDSDQTRNTTGVAGGVTYTNRSTCYDGRQKEPGCTKKKAIIVGSVIGVLFVVLGVLYLYATCSDRRKKRKTPPPAAENEPLSDKSGNISDLEQGVAEANKNDTDEGGNDFTLHDKSDKASVFTTSATVSDLPSYAGPLGLTSTYKPLETPGFGRTPLVKP